MDVAAKIIRLRPDSEERVRDWAKTLNARRNEALATLEDEGVAIESWFQVSLEGHEYLIAYMRAHSMNHAEQVAKTSKHEIDRYHTEFKDETWDRSHIVDAALLVDLTRG